MNRCRCFKRFVKTYHGYCELYNRVSAWPYQDLREHSFQRRYFKFCIHPDSRIYRLPSLVYFPHQGSEFDLKCQKHFNISINYSGTKFNCQSPEEFAKRISTKELICDICKGSICNIDQIFDLFKIDAFSSEPAQDLFNYFQTILDNFENKIFIID